MKIARIFFGVALLYTPIQSLAQSAEPPGIARFRSQLISECQGVGGGRARFEPGFSQRVNISPDGVPDYVLDASKVDCPGARTFTCGSAGCPVQVLVSQGGRHVVALDDYAQEVRVVSNPDGDIVIHNGRRLRWDGARLAAAGAAAAPGPQAARGAAQGGAWRVVTHNGMQRAETTGTGNLRNALLYCTNQRGAVMAISLHRPMANQIPVMIEIGNLRVTAPFNRFAPDSLFWEVEGQPMRTLPTLFAGQSREALLTVGGQPIGSVSLDGAAVALRTALAACHRFPGG